MEGESQDRYHPSRLPLEMGAEAADTFPALSRNSSDTGTSNALKGCPGVYAGAGPSERCRHGLMLMDSSQEPKINILFAF